MDGVKAVIVPCGRVRVREEERRRRFDALFAAHSSDVVA
jgi:hypothetical protein